METCADNSIGKIKAVMFGPGPGKYFYETVNGKRRRVPAYTMENGTITKIHPKVQFFKMAVR